MSRSPEKLGRGHNSAKLGSTDTRRDLLLRNTKALLARVVNTSSPNSSVKLVTKCGLRAFKTEQSKNLIDSRQKLIQRFSDLKQMKVLPQQQFLIIALLLHTDFYQVVKDIMSSYRQEDIVVEQDKAQCIYTSIRLLASYPELAAHEALAIVIATGDLLLDSMVMACVQEKTDGVLNFLFVDHSHTQRTLRRLMPPEQASWLTKLGRSTASIASPAITRLSTFVLTAAGCLQTASAALPRHFATAFCKDDISEQRLGGSLGGQHSDNFSQNTGYQLTVALTGVAFALGATVVTWAYCRRRSSRGQDASDDRYHRMEEEGVYGTISTGRESKPNIPDRDPGDDEKNIRRVITL